MVQVQFLTSTHRTISASGAGTGTGFLAIQVHGKCDMAEPYMHNLVAEFSRKLVSVCVQALETPPGKDTFRVYMQAFDADTLQFVLPDFPVAPEVHGFLMSLWKQRSWRNIFTADAWQERVEITSELVASDMALQPSWRASVQWDNILTGVGRESEPCVFSVAVRRATSATSWRIRWASKEQPLAVCAECLPAFAEYCAKAGAVPTVLARRNAHPRDARIRFVEETHQYFIDGSCDGYISCTTLVHALFPKFDEDEVIRKIFASKRFGPDSKYWGRTAEDIKAEWRANGAASSEAGTRMHFDIECYYNELPVSNDSVEYRYFQAYERARVKAAPWMEPFRTEWCVFAEDIQLAGSIDMIYRDTRNGHLLIYDWKRCREIKRENRWDSGVLPATAHLPDCNYWHYALQLNIYRWILQTYYGMVVDDLHLVVLHPENPSYRKIRLPLMDETVEAVIQWRRAQMQN